MLSNLIKKIKDMLIDKDPTAKNCEVYIHREKAELVVINAQGKVECYEDNFYLSDAEAVDIEDNAVIVYLDRSKFEYLGEL